jgi:hypothetical protein
MAVVGPIRIKTATTCDNLNDLGIHLWKAKDASHTRIANIKAKQNKGVLAIEISSESLKTTPSKTIPTRVAIEIGSKMSPTQTFSLRLKEDLESRSLSFATRR